MAAATEAAEAVEAAEAERSEGRLATATSTSAEAPQLELVHDGESYQIYRAVLPAASFDHATSESEREPRQKIDVAIKTCRPNGYGDVVNLNNEYNTLRLNTMANCHSARIALKRDKSFEAPHNLTENGGGPKAATAIYFKWAEGTTLSEWLKEAKKEDGILDDGKGESERFLAKVSLASEVANAVASIHEAGVVHNDLSGDNIIVSFGHHDRDIGSIENSNSRSSKCRVTIIDFEYANQFSDLEGNDEGDRVNDDIPHLATILRSIFAMQKGGDSKQLEGVSQPRGSGTSLNTDPHCRRLSFTYVRGDFSRTFQNENESGVDEDDHNIRKQSIAQSVYDFDDSFDDTCDDDGKPSIATSTDGASLTSSDDRSSSYIFGVPRTSKSGKEDEDFDDGTLPPNLPKSVRRVLADIEDVGRGKRETAYHDAREVAEDLRQMASDPAVFLADPKRGDHASSAFRRPPRRLYGRENELAALKEAEGRLTDENRGSDAGSRTEVILIAGRSGTGKSSLLRQAKSDSKGVFVVGKFDQLQSMRPYSAVIAAFDRIVHSILAEGAEVVSKIKEDILDAVGTNGKVLTDIIPSLVEVIGEQPNVAHVTGNEALNRFRHTVNCFARAICTPQRPLICVLDDLQWCDPASIGLIKTLVTDESNKHLLFIGGYRADEMDADHHVSVQFDLMKKANVQFTTIELGDMDEDSLTSLVSEKLRLPRRLTKSLGEIVHRKSLGNAFFATTFLQSLVEDRLLTFSLAKMRWIWDEAEADAKIISDDVVEVMADRIQTFNSGAQNLLKNASCIGATFDMSLVKSSMSEAADKSTLDKHLKMLVKQGLIIKMRHRDVNEDVIHYKFSHDRIQQAAYSLVSTSEKEALHLRIGRMLKKELPDTGTIGLIFRTVDQLNRGILCMSDRDEQVELAELNARAAKEAYNACAFTPSTAYTKKSLGILGSEDTMWNNHYDLALTLHNLLAELKYCVGDFNEAMQISRCTVKRAKTFDDRFIAQTCILNCMMLKGDLDNASNGCLDILRALGATFPKNPSLGAVMIELIKTKKALRKKTNEDFMSLPEMTDERIIKSTKIYSILSAVSYLQGSNYAAIVPFKRMRLMLKYGLSDSCPWTITLYGFLIYAILKDLKGAFRFGQLGLSLSRKAIMPRSCFMMHCCVTHWRDNLELSIDPFLNGYKGALEIGDIEYAINNVNLYNIYRLHSGRFSIHTIIQQQQASLQELTKVAASSCSDMLLPNQQLALNLAGHSQDPVLLSGDAMDEEGLLRISVKTANVMLEYIIRVNVAVVSYIFGAYDRASMHSQKIQDVAEKCPGTFLINNQAFFDGLSSYAIAKTTTNHKKWRKRGRKMMKQFAKWAKDCPSINAHRVLLLKAEDASLFAVKSKKKREIAEQAYTAAISGARDNGFVNVAAIASERAAEFYKSIGQERLFSSHIAQAYQLYFKWGADGKCDYIARKYSSLTFNAHDGYQ